VISFSLNRIEIILRASLVLQDLFHAPTPSNAIVRASKPVFAAQVEKLDEFILNVWPGELFDRAVVHDGELLLFVVGGSGGTRFVHWNFRRVVDLGVIVVAAVPIVWFKAVNAAWGLVEACGQVVA
jgi:hypothetical protein